MGSTKIISGTQYRAIMLVLLGLTIVCGYGQLLLAEELFDTVIEVRGKLKDVRRNIMTVTRDDGTDVAVMLHEDPTKLVFAAEAKPQWIKPGMLVRVESMFSANGQPPAPLDTVEIFQPFQARMSSAQADMYVPGIHSMDRKPAAANGQQGIEPGKYRIIGSLVGGGAAGIMINANQTQVPIPLTANAKWLIRFNNLTLAEPGDVVHVTGFHQPPNETEVKASNVRIVVDRVFGEVTENPRAKKKSRAKPDDNPAAPETAEATKPEP